MKEEAYFEMLQQKWDNLWPHPSLPKKPVYPLGEIPLHNYLETYAQKQPDKDYLIFYGTRITYAEMDRRANGFANYLLSLGLQKGDRVALVLPNLPQFYIGYFGTFKAGGVCVLVNPLLKQIELEYTFNESKPRVVITLDALFPLVSAAAQKISADTVVLGTALKQFLPDDPEIALHESMQPLLTPGQEGITDLMDAIESQPESKPDVSVDTGDYATMNFTGGTTGMPKGVLHKHRNIIYTGACGYTYFFAHLLVETHEGKQVDYNAFLEQTAATEVGLAGMPIFWIAGNDMGVVFPTFAGSTSVLLFRWDPKAALQSIEKYKITSTYATFDQYMQFLQDPEIGKYNLRSLRSCTGSSFINPLTPELRQQWKDLTGAILREASYGLTETHTMDTMTAGFHKNDLDIKKQEKNGGTFCGIPFPGTKIKIADADGNPVPPGSDGQILITSPSVVEGYLGKPEETAKSFQGGWLHTGDVGRYDEDGFFYYLSRTKYMLKVSGVSVYPAQIEFILLAHPEVELVGVVGVQDEKKGQAPVAYVKLREGSTCTADELLKWSRQNMSPHNVPKEIRIRDALPLTATGKVIREELLEKK